MRRLRWVVPVMLLVVLAGCAGTTNVVTPPREMTALEKAQMASLSFLERYRAQYVDTAAMGAMMLEGKLTPGQVEVYNVKRELLVKAEQLIKMFDKLVAGGSVPGVDKEQEINDVLNQLLAASQKGG